jgi:hypothetical protein
MPDPKDLSIWDLFFFSWYTPLLQLGLQRPLQQKDVWTLRPEHSASNLANPVKTVTKAWQIFRGSDLYVMYYKCGIFRLLTEMFAMCTPFLLNQLMLSIGDKNSMIAKQGQHTRTEGYILAGLMLVAAVAQSVTLNQYIGLCFETGAHARAVTMHMVYAKTLKLEPSAVQDISTGQLLNLMSKDAAKIQARPLPSLDGVAANQNTTTPLPLLARANPPHPSPPPRAGVAARPPPSRLSPAHSPAWPRVLCPAVPRRAPRAPCPPCPAGGYCCGRRGCCRLRAR